MPPWSVRARTAVSGGIWHVCRLLMHLKCMLLQIEIYTDEHGMLVFKGSITYTYLPSVLTQTK
eukprot:23527-Eustigmatos_ZCMA.PRE.1